METTMTDIELTNTKHGIRIEIHSRPEDGYRLITVNTRSNEAIDQRFYPADMLPQMIEYAKNLIK
jgi:hypothetical protein